MGSDRRFTFTSPRSGAETPLLDPLRRQRPSSLQLPLAAVHTSTRGSASAEVSPLLLLYPTRTKTCSCFPEPGKLSFSSASGSHFHNCVPPSILTPQQGYDFEEEAKDEKVENYDSERERCDVDDRRKRAASLLRRHFGGEKILCKDHSRSHTCFSPCTTGRAPNVSSEELLSIAPLDDAGPVREQQQHQPEEFLTPMVTYSFLFDAPRPPAPLQLHLEPILDGRRPSFSAPSSPCPAPLPPIITTTPVITALPSPHKSHNTGIGEGNECYCCCSVDELPLPPPSSPRLPSFLHTDKKECDCAPPVLDSTLLPSELTDGGGSDGVPLTLPFFVHNPKKLSSTRKVKAIDAGREIVGRHTHM